LAVVAEPGCRVPVASIHWSFGSRSAWWPVRATFMGVASAAQQVITKRAT